jgi:hypothetical protein
VCGGPGRCRGNGIDDGGGGVSSDSISASGDIPQRFLIVFTCLQAMLLLYGRPGVHVSIVYAPGRLCQENVGCKLAASSAWTFPRLTVFISFLYSQNMATDPLQEKEGLRNF